MDRDKQDQPGLGPPAIHNVARMVRIASWPSVAEVPPAARQGLASPGREEPAQPGPATRRPARHCHGPQPLVALWVRSGAGLPPTKKATLFGAASNLHLSCHSGTGGGANAAARLPPRAAGDTATLSWSIPVCEARGRFSRRRGPAISTRIPAFFLRGVAPCFRRGHAGPAPVDRPDQPVVQQERDAHRDSGQRPDSGPRTQQE